MVDYALGLVETKGLVAAIEAADTMVKTANVTLIGKEVTRGALVTIKIIGDTAAVRSAVEAGAAAAQRVGELVSKHIIPRPGDGLEELIFAQHQRTQEEEQQILVEQPSDSDTIEIPLPDQPSVIPLNKQSDEVGEELKEVQKEIPAPEEIYMMPEGLSSEMQAYFKELDLMTVHELRHHARSSTGLSIHGRQISRANKKELMDELLKSKRA